MLGIGSLPARSAVFDDAEIQAKYPSAKSAQASLEALKPRPVTPFYPRDVEPTPSSRLRAGDGASKTRPEQAIKQMSEGLRKIATKIAQCGTWRRDARTIRPDALAPGDHPGISGWSPGD